MARDKKNVRKEKARKANARKLKSMTVTDTVQVIRTEPLYIKERYLTKKGKRLLAEGVDEAEVNAKYSKVRRIPNPNSQPLMVDGEPKVIIHRHA